MLKLRPFQEESLRSVVEDFYAGVNNTVLSLPTGVGKTVIFAHLPDYIGIGNRRMMVLAHTDELCQQAADKLRKCNPNRTVGVEKATSYAGDAQLVVASIQTLSRSPERLTAFDPNQFAILVTDECHHATSDSYGKVYDHLRVKERNDILNLGVTATVNRADGKGLNLRYDKISKKYTIIDAMRDGWLSDLRCKRVSTTVNIDGVLKRGKDFDLTSLSNALDTPDRNSLVVKAYEDHGENRKFLGFAVDIQHAKNLAEKFQDKGYSVEAVWGDDRDRDDKLKRHREGQLTGLFNCAFLTEGYDDWSIQCIILARSTQSTSLLTQIVGRGLRIPDGCANLKEALSNGDKPAKVDCLVLDIADVATKHTLATVPSLFGLGDKLDLRGRSMLQTATELDLLKAKKPYLNLSTITDIDNLQTYAEQVDMFRVEAPSEVVQLSQYRWMRHGEDAYYLALMDGEYLFVIPDFIGNWDLSGTCNGNTIYKQKASLDEAIREGDYIVEMLGGRVNKNMAKRVTKAGTRPPSKAQLDLLRKLGLRPPPGMSSGEIRDVISKRLMELKYRKKNNANF